MGLKLHASTEPAFSAARFNQIKWDTVSLNFPRNSLKAKEGGTNKVGHFIGGLDRVEQHLKKR